jgi:hypothetical protein
VGQVTVIGTSAMTKYEQVIEVLKEEGKIAAIRKHRELYQLPLDQTIRIINELNYELTLK